MLRHGQPQYHEVAPADDLDLGMVNADMTAFLEIEREENAGAVCTCRKGAICANCLEAKT